jgi:hypothetical protein
VKNEVWRRKRYMRKMLKIIKVKDNGPRKEDEEKKLEQRMKKVTKGGRRNML